MKKLKYIAMAFAALLLASCMGDGYADSVGEKDYTGPAIGNNKLEATNVITISELKEKGVRLIDQTPRYGAGGARIAFVHPKATGGVLLELCERK